MTFVVAVTKAAAWDHDPKRPPRAAKTTEPCCPAAAAGHLFLHNPGELGDQGEIAMKPLTFYSSVLVWRASNVPVLEW